MLFIIKIKQMRPLASINPSRAVIGVEHLGNSHHCASLSFSLSLDLNYSLQSCFQRWPFYAFPSSWFHWFSVVGFCNSAHFDTFTYDWVLLFRVELSSPGLYVVLKFRDVWDPGWICHIILKFLISWFVRVGKGRLIGDFWVRRTSLVNLNLCSLSTVLQKVRLLSL